MPNRYLRESYKESEAVNSVGWQAEVMWTRLIVTVDDWGRCEANPKLLRAKLFPLRLDAVRESDMSRLLAECEKAGLIRLYQADNKEYLQMNKWERGRAEKSRYPAPVDNCKPLQTIANNGSHPSTDAPDSDSDSGTESDSDKRARTGEPEPEPEPEPDFHPPGWEPPLEMFIAACARHSIPPWYAEVKWEVHSAKGWASGKTPLKWQKVVAWVARDFVNDGSPATEQDAAPRTGKAEKKGGMFLT